MNESEVILNHELATQRLDLGVRLSWKLLNSWGAKLSDADILSIVGISICETQKTFRDSYNVQFQTLLFYHLRGRLLKEISETVKYNRFNTVIQNNNHIRNESEEDDNNDIIDQYQQTKSPEEILIDREKENNFDSAINNLDWLEGVIIRRHCINEESLLNLSKELNYCRCHLSRVKTKALRKLRVTMKTYFSPDTDLKEKNGKSYKGVRGRRVLDKT